MMLDCRYNGHASCLELLFEETLADEDEFDPCVLKPDGVDHHGRTALHIAALRGHKAAVDVLLQAGCNPNLQTKDGFTRE